MNRTNRLANDPAWPHSPTVCDDGNPHRWELANLASEPGRGRIAYLVCMWCHSWTYAEMEDVGFVLVPQREEEQE